jgi:amino acid transporter
VRRADILTNTTSVYHNPTIYAFALVGLIGTFTLVGFELAADISEDAVSPQCSVPRGVIWAEAGSAVLGMIALIGFTEAIPYLKTVETAPLLGRVDVVNPPAANSAAHSSAAIRAVSACAASGVRI